MKKLLLVLMFVFTTTLSFASIGIKGGYSKGAGDSSDYSGIALGVDYMLNLGPIYIGPEIMYTNWSFERTIFATTWEYSTNDIQLNANALFKTPLGIYIGAGLGLNFLQSTIKAGSSENKGDRKAYVGFQGILGFELGLPGLPIKPFIEGRYQIITSDNDSTANYIYIMGGINIDF